MTTISLRVNDDESKLIHDYVSVNQLNMSQFIRDAVLDKIENDFDLDEDRILYAFEKAIHGQHEHQSLLNKKKHMIILKFGKCLVSKCIK